MSRHQHPTVKERHDAAELERVLLRRAERQIADLATHEIGVRGNERRRITDTLLGESVPSDDFEGCVE